MKIYWSLKSIPELKDKPLKLRWEAWLACVWDTYRHWEVWVISLALVLAFSPVLFGNKLLALGLAVPIGLLLGHVQSAKARPYLRRYLADRGKSKPAR